MSIKTPRLIRDRCGVYYFRLIVPLSWRDTVKRTEIRRSLRTKDVSIARQAGLLLPARMEAFMADSKESKLDRSRSTGTPNKQLRQHIDVGYGFHVLE